MNYFDKPAEEALSALKTGMEGLSETEAAARKEQYGPNKLSEGKKKTALGIFLSQFKDLLVFILAVAAIISMVSGNIESTLVIFAVLILNAVLGTVQSVSYTHLDVYKRQATISMAIESFR